MEFDPASGDWIPVAPASAPPPDAPRHGVGYTLWTVLLGLDLAVLGALLLGSAYLALTGQGGGLVGNADLRTALWAQVAFNLVTLGLIPLAWVVGTRVRPWEGALRYLRLHAPGRGLATGALWGVASLAALVALGALLKAVDYNPP
ncbi:MAG: hypothetical protein QOI63_376, partial [Thermoplasmata archaeon]|nr:hypothetical protein [Thermoplasmata archaeon]